MNILVVDDNATNRKLLRAILQADGLDTHEAADGVEALAVLERDPVDAIISDILMPNMDGYRLCHEVRQRERLCRIPFVIYTNTFTSPGDEKIAFELGADDYLKKPAPAARILAALHDAVARAPLRHPQPPRPEQELALMKTYSEQLVVKLEEKNTQLIQQAEELNRSHSLLSAVIEGTNDIVFVRDLEGHHLLINSAGARFLGRTVEEVIGKTLAELVPPEVFRQFDEDDRQVLASRRSQTYERTVTWAGVRRTLLITKGPLRDIEGNISGILGISRDISERKRIEEALQESEEVFRRLSDSSPLGIMLMDKQGQCTYANPRGRAILGVKTLAWVGAGWTRFVHPQDRQPMLDEWVAASGEGREFSREFRLRLADGTVRWVRLQSSPSLSDNGELRGSVATVEDITVRKQSEESVARLAAIVQFSDDAIISRALDGTILSWNRGAERIFGHRPDAVIGKFISILSSPEGLKELSQINEKLRRDQRLEHFETTRLRKDGTQIHVSLSVSPLKDSTGKLMGASVIARDITERKRGEEAMRALSVRLMKAQDEERRHIARELHDSTSQKLAALMMNLGTLAYKITAEQSTQKKIVADSLALVEACSQEVRTISYLLHPPLLDELGLLVSIRSYVEGFSKRSGIRMTLDLPAKLPALPAGTELALFRVVQESLGNVHRHSGSRAASVRLMRQRSRVVLEVRDRGHGLTLKELKQGCEDASLLGVGIAGMQERLQYLGGSLGILSGARGTTVRAIVPLAGKS